MRFDFATAEEKNHRNSIHICTYIHTRPTRHRSPNRSLMHGSMPNGVGIHILVRRSHSNKRCACPVKMCPYTLAQNGARPRGKIQSKFLLGRSHIELMRQERGRLFGLLWRSTDTRAFLSDQKLTSQRYVFPTASAAMCFPLRVSLLSASSILPLAMVCTT